MKFTVETRFHGRQWIATLRTGEMIGEDSDENLSVVDHAPDERIAIMRVLHQVRFEGDPDPAVRRRPNLDTP
jgi:hypothetical protein